MVKPKLTKEDRDKASRKAIPRTLQAWLSEVQGIDRFVRAKTTLADTNGTAWLKSMQGYYRNRLLVLAENPPHGWTKAMAEASMKETLSKLPG